MQDYLNLLDLHRLIVLTSYVQLAFWLASLLFIYKFLFFLRPFCSKNIPDGPLPKAAIIMCVRGVDPNLTSCIHALLNQDYPNYTLKIVVDSITDQSWALIQKTISASEFQHVDVKPLTTRYNTCSLKCSALIQAVNELDESYEVVAFVDADVETQPDWLLTLVTPLLIKNVGVSTGVRLYMPAANQWGAVSRSLWNNALAAPGLYVGKVPWGGSMAMRLSVLAKGKILEAWKHALVEDAALPGHLKKLKLKVKYVPLPLVNRETCSLADCWLFIRRQIVLMYVHQKMNTILYLTVSSVLSLLILSPIIIGLIALWRHDFNSFLWASIDLAGCIFLLSTIFFIMECKMLKIANGEGESLILSTLSKFMKVMILMPFNIMTQLWTGLSAVRATKVNWRGIEYAIMKHRQIKLLAYKPYVSSNTRDDNNDSLL